MRFVICEIVFVFAQIKYFEVSLEECKFMLSFLAKQVAIHPQEIKEKVLHL